MWDCNRRYQCKMMGGDFIGGTTMDKIFCGGYIIARGRCCSLRNHASWGGGRGAGRDVKSYY